jgi:hypothetical protein
LLIDLLMYDIGEFGEEAEEAVSSGAGVPPVWAGRLLDELIRFDR